jgi:hypothetical protein
MKQSGVPFSLSWSKALGFDQLRLNGLTNNQYRINSCTDPAEKSIFPKSLALTYTHHSAGLPGLSSRIQRKFFSIFK